MNINNPTKDNLSSFQLVLRWAQSVYKALNGGLSFGNPASQAASGVWNTFTPDNFGGVLLYIGSSSSGAALTWNANNIGKAFNHGLQRQPVGFIVVWKDKTCDIWGTATPTTDLITLANSDVTTNTIILVF